MVPGRAQSANVDRSPKPNVCFGSEADANEERFLATVAKRFGIPDNEFSCIKARHVAPTKESPYDILGVTPDISNDALKTHYRRLVVETHPDKMVARGVPSECVSMATKKVAAINAAYEAVAKERHI
jgi:DnaJ like chaperone protein